MLCSRLKIHVFAHLCSFTFVFDDLHAETYHPEGCFRGNKPNSLIAQINLSYLSTMNYEIPRAHREKKQTQFKPNSKPILPLLKDLYILYPLAGIKK